MNRKQQVTNNIEKLLEDFKVEYADVLSNTVTIEKYLAPYTSEESIRLVIEAPFVLTKYIEVTDILISKFMTTNLDIILLQEINSSIQALDSMAEHHALHEKGLTYNNKEELYEYVISDIKVFEQTSTSINACVKELTQ